jgi:hypothetical protein
MGRAANFQVVKQQIRVSGGRREKILSTLVSPLSAHPALIAQAIDDFKTSFWPLFRSSEISVD